jgi:hypothetical protein
LERERSSGSRSRSRSRGNSGARNRGITDILSQRKAQNAIRYAMIALSLLYVGLVTYKVRQAAIMYGFLNPGMSRADVLYFSGAPTRVRHDGGWQAPGAGHDASTATEWSYERPDSGRIRALFDPASGKMTRISCAEDNGASLACPSTLSIAIGTTEDRIWYLLGRPTRQAYRGDVKIIDYDDLGLQFSLRRFSVFEIGLSERSGPLSWLPRVPRVLVP